MHSGDRVSGPKTVRTKQEVRTVTKCSGLNICFAATQGMVKISCQGILKKNWSNVETRAETRTNKLRNSNQWWPSYLNFCKAYIWGNDINNDRKICNEWERAYLFFFDNSSFPFFCLIFYLHGRSSQSMTCLPLGFP